MGRAPARQRRPAAPAIAGTAPLRPDTLDRIMDRLPQPLQPLAGLAMMPVALLCLPLLVLALIRHDPVAILVGLGFWGGFVWMFLAYFGLA